MDINDPSSRVIPCNSHPFWTFLHTVSPINNKILFVPMRWRIIVQDLIDVDRGSRRGKNHGCISRAFLTLQLRVLRLSGLAEGAEAADVERRDAPWLRDA